MHFKCHNLHLIFKYLNLNLLNPLICEMLNNHLNTSYATISYVECYLISFKVRKYYFIRK